MHEVFVRKYNEKVSLRPEEEVIIKSYLMPKGNEYIIHVLEGRIISDLYTFLTVEPANYNVDAIEDAELLPISTSANEELLPKKNWV